MKIKTNDNVKILSGKDKGRIGKVLQVFPAEQKAVVEGMNKIKKHLRTQKTSEKGQVIELSGPMQMSKLMLICPKCQQPTRVGSTVNGDKKQRICKACKALID